MITSDCHMHTFFSEDGDTPPEVMAESAIEKGMKMICITDHLDLDYPISGGLGTESYSPDLDEYFQKLEEMQKAFDGRLEIRKGVEFGMQPHLGEKCRELAENYPLDFLIGSVHLVQHTDPYYGEIFEAHPDGEAYQIMFQETLKCLESTDAFDILGHIDYIVRYGKHREKEYSYQAFAPVLDEILRKVIRTGKGIELNTSGWKYGLGFCHPHPEVLKHYRELGGEIITVGSDAHRPEHVAYDFRRAEKVLADCGFRYYTEFKERKPVFKKIGL